MKILELDPDLIVTLSNDPVLYENLSKIAAGADEEKIRPRSRSIQARYRGFFLAAGHFPGLAELAQGGRRC